jgi:hypothetical protein
MRQQLWCGNALPPAIRPSNLEFVLRVPPNRRTGGRVRRQPHQASDPDWQSRSSRANVPRARRRPVGAASKLLAIQRRSLSAGIGSLDSFQPISGRLASGRHDSRHVAVFGFQRQHDSRPPAGCRACFLLNVESGGNRPSQSCQGFVNVNRCTVMERNANSVVIRSRSVSSWRSHSPPGATSLQEFDTAG